MKVALLVTCLTDTYFPRVAVAIVRVLRHFGCQVEFPTEQTCCGQPAYNSGYPAEAAALARRMIRLFEPYEQVVTPSASCAAMVGHFAELFAHDPALKAGAQALAARTHEFATFLTRKLGVDVAEHLRFDEPVTFHHACHSRGIHTPAELAGWVAGRDPQRLRPPEQTELCCGFGGLFSVDFPQISGAMLTDRLDDLAATGAQVVVCNEGGCTLHLAGGAHRRGLPLRFKHLAECLAEALGLLEPQP